MIRDGNRSVFVDTWSIQTLRTSLGSGSNTYVKFGFYMLEIHFYKQLIEY